MTMQTGWIAGSGGLGMGIIYETSRRAEYGRYASDGSISRASC